MSAGRSAHPADGPAGTDTVVRAGLYALMTSIVSRMLQFARAIVVARLLVPEEFGRFALVAVTVGIAEAVSQPGLFAAIVQAERVSRRAVQTVWNVHVVRGAVLTTAVFVLAPRISSLLGAPETAEMLRAMSFVMLIHALRSMSVVLRIRQVDLAPDARIKGATEVFETVAAVALVAVTRSAWGLVWARLATLGLEVGASYLVPGFRPALVFAWTELRRLLAFGRWMFVTGLFTYASTNLDDLIVGRVAGTGPLGLYRVSYRFATVVSTELGLAAGRAAEPALARARWSPGSDAFEGFRRLLVLTVGLAAPASLVMLATSHLVVDALLGEAWQGAATPLGIMAVGGLFRAVAESGAPLFTGMGRPRLLTTLNVTRTVVMLGALVPLVQWQGVVGAAFAFLLGEVAAVPVWAWGLRQVGVQEGVAVRATIPRLGPAGLAAATAWAVGTTIDDTPIALVAAILASVVVWGVLVHQADRPLRTEMRELLAAARRLSGRGRGSAGTGVDPS